MIRFVLGLCGYVPAARLEDVREDRRHWYGSWSEACRTNARHAQRIAALESELTTLRAQLPNRDKAGKFTRRI